jgi:hypothetical protein
MNYYTFVDNRPKLMKIYWILRESLKKTICLKKKMSQSEFHQCFGKTIKLRVRKRDGSVVSLEFSPPICERDPNYFLGTRDFTDPLLSKE